MTKPLPYRLAHTNTIQWANEISFYCPRVSVFLVGCKNDLRRDPVVVDDLAKMSQKPISYEEVRKGLPWISSANLTVIFDTGHLVGTEDWR